MENAATSLRIPFWRTLLISLLVTGAVWTFFHWPMLSRGLDAIPYRADSQKEEHTFHFMEPGDHLQLMYHFWLLDDMIRGDTPWFGNIYEFNLGNDAERREPGTYYFPFSLFFTIGNEVAGRAAGWNLAGFLSLWLTLLFMVMLLRRFLGFEAAVWILATATLVFPYRWFALAGGSPSGFAMCWPPLLFLGLDIAVREERWRGGVIAGAALLLCAWGDTHAYFFGALFTPIWCLFLLLRRDNLPDWPRGWFRIALRLSPILLFIVIAMLTTKNMTGNVAVARGPRTWAEVRLSSPAHGGFFSWNELGHSNHIFIGASFALLLGLGVLAAVVVYLRDAPRRREVLGFGLLVCAILAAAELSTGTNGLWHGLALRAARKLIPKYDMIRQTAKIMTVMPPMLLIASALSISMLRITTRNERVGLIAGLFFAASCVAERANRFHLHFATLAEEQPAYAALAEDAAKRNEKPHALVIPFWPGDSHYTSVYQHYASLYRIRMVNGYRPFVPETYRKGVFPKFESANVGELSDAQLDELLGMGVNAIVLHEDLFPEKVSPRPVAYTLRALLNHPRLSLLAHAGTVWSWRIEREPRPHIVPQALTWSHEFPTQKTHKTNPPPVITLQPGETLTLPAPEFFHAGAINLTNNTVEFDPARDRTGTVLYGPRRTFAPGIYEITVNWTHQPYTRPDAHFGELHIEEPENHRRMTFQLHGGMSCTFAIRLFGNGPLLLLFDYAGKEPVELRSIDLRRLN